jgi:hypothetical protein
VGGDYSTGDYGADEKTDVWLVPMILRARTGDLSISTSVTYIKMSGPADVVIGPDGEQLPGVPSGGGVREGLSDLSVSAGYTFSGRNAEAPSFALTGRVKIPTSKPSAQLGTGKVDYSVRAEVSTSVGPLLPFASLGFRVLGDPEGIDLRNGVNASIGASATIGRRVLIASFDYSTSASEGTASSRSLFGGFSTPVAENLNITAYGVKGLSESSPDYGIGLLLSMQVL